MSAQTAARPDSLILLAVRSIWTWWDPSYVRIPPRTRLRVVGWIPPTPQVSTLILGPAKPPETRPQEAEFLRFFRPCGAKSRGVGGLRPLP